MRLLMLGGLVAMAASGSAWADTQARPAPAKPAVASVPSARWDDSHMRSRYQETAHTDRLRISGESGYGALASGSAESSDDHVQQLEFTSQRQWVQGPLSTSPTSKSQGGDFSKSGGSGISRGSQIRSGSVHSGR